MMAFLNGLLLLNAPASALNNAGAAETGRTDNIIAVKAIRTKEGFYPYVSAQAFRFWLRTTLENSSDLEWKAAPIFREKKIAYTDANPIEWWDDDLFGYMRAQGKKKEQKEDREERMGATKMTETEEDITRISPFRVSTFVSLGPVSITEDFGVMSRHEGDPVPHEHQFYRTILKGIFSLDLNAAGTFTYKLKTGYKNLDRMRKEKAEEAGLEHLEEEKAYRLPVDERLKRISSLLRGLGVLCGGAKQTLHYTDVTPVVFIAAVFKGGNNPLYYWIGADRGEAVVKEEAWKETLRVWRDQFLSPVYIGWTQGFATTQREKAGEIIANLEKDEQCNFVVGHPRELIEKIIKDMAENKWLG